MMTTFGAIDPDMQGLWTDAPAAAPRPGGQRFLRSAAGALRRGLLSRLRRWGMAGREGARMGLIAPVGAFGTAADPLTPIRALAPAEHGGQGDGQGGGPR